MARRFNTYFRGRRRLVFALGLSSLAVGLAVAPLPGSSDARIANPEYQPQLGVLISHGDLNNLPANSIEVLAKDHRLEADATNEPFASGQQPTVAIKPMPATRASFMAVWANVAGAAGYRLDVSTQSSFASYISGYQDLDVGNITTWIVAG